MLLSLGEVISLATQFAGRSDFSTSEVSRLANLALTEVTSRTYMRPKEQLAISNVTGTGDERRIGLPNDFDGLMAIKFYSSSTDPASGDNLLGTASERGLEIDLAVVEPTLLDSFSSTSGTPVRFCIYGGNVELDPIPDSRGSFLMRYLAKQQTLILSTSTPDLDERWHMGWLNKTEEMCHRARGNHAAANEAERRYVNYMTSTPNDRNQAQMAKQGLGLWVRKA